MSYPESPWPFLLDFARLAVLVLLVSKGGRYERALALMLVPVWLAEQLALRLPDGAWSSGVAGAADLAFLAGQVSVLWRYRPAWLVSATLVQAGKALVVLVFAPDLGAPEGLAGWTVLGLAFTHLACLGLGAVSRRLGPPAPVPASEP